MSLSKLKQIHIIIIGAFLCIAAAAGMFFLIIKPQNEKLAAATSRRDAAATVGNASSEQQAIAEFNAAVLKVTQTKQQLDVEMKRRMPDLSFARREYGMLELWKEYTKVLGPLLNGFARDKNVTIQSAHFQMPPLPTTPNDPVFDMDVIQIQLGSVQATGDFKSLMDNVRRWNNCKRLVMVGPPALNGSGPHNLSVAYQVTCYIFPVEKGGPMIQMAGGTGAAGGGTPGMPR
ncbi:MAG: hypothetical protein M1133_04655 [Armatimonadetes bacterium]|nr:hypothetical protein [Armatimonadota bacterium]